MKIEYAPNQEKPDGIAGWDFLEPPRVALEVGHAAILGDWSNETIAEFQQEEDQERHSERILDLDYPEGAFRIR